MLKAYKIAGLTVEMDTFGKTLKQAEKFETEQTGAVDFTVSSDSVPFKRWENSFTPESAEYVKTGIDFYNKLLKYDGMILHSSAVVLDGYAYLFTAASGTGKSTHTRLWCENFDGAVILNDDKPAMKLEKGTWYAYGTPWSGKTDLNLNLCVPIGGIAVLERDALNSIERIGGKKAVYAVLNQTVRPSDEAMRMKVVELVSDLLGKVPVWLLKCNTENDAAVLSKEAMTAARPEIISKDD